MGTGRSEEIRLAIFDPDKIRKPRANTTRLHCIISQKTVLYLHRREKLKSPDVSVIKIDLLFTMYE
jgi:hypothetical protein